MNDKNFEKITEAICAGNQRLAYPDAYWLVKKIFKIAIQYNDFNELYEDEDTLTKIIIDIINDKDECND